MSITIPWFSSNIIRIMAGDPIFQMKQYKISKKLYRIIMFRLMSGDDDKTSALSFSRVLLSNYRITQNAVSNNYNVNTADFLTTVYVALFVHN